MKLYFFLVLFSSALFWGCSDDNSGYDGSIHHFTPDKYKGIEAELNNAEFYCSSSSNCPSNVGLIFTNLDGNDYNPRMGQCTGFLIAEDIVATNSHCIPERLKTSDADCTSQIAIRFIENSGKNKIFGCKKILDYSPLGGLDPDYAFFRISPTGIAPFQIHKGGLKDNQNIKVAKITPLSHSIGGKLEIESCKIALGTLLNLGSTNSWSDTAVGLGCQAVGGNSGSPVLNDDNQVVGILQSYLKDQYNKIIEESFKKFKLILPDTIRPHMLFTNLSCVADPVTGKFNKEKCAYGESVSLTDCIDFENEKTRANGERFYEGWKSDLPSIFVYEFITLEKALITQAHPICIKPKSKYSDYDRYVSLEGVYGFRKERISLVYPRAVTVGIRFSVDDEYRIIPEMRFVEELRSSYRINITEENNLWTGTMNSTYSDWRMGFDFTELKNPVSLPECAEEQLSSDEISKVKLVNGDILTEQEYILIQESKEKKLCER